MPETYRADVTMLLTAASRTRLDERSFQSQPLTRIKHFPFVLALSARFQSILTAGAKSTAFGGPQKLTTSARIDLTRSQTDHAAWQADGRDLPHPCRRRVYR